MAEEKNEIENSEKRKLIVEVAEASQEDAPKQDKNPILEALMFIGIACLFLLLFGIGTLIAALIGEIFLRLLALLFPIFLIAELAAYIVLCVQRQTFTPWD